MGRTTLANKWLVMWVLFGMLTLAYKGTGNTSELSIVTAIFLLLTYIMYRRFMRFAVGK